MRGDTVRTAIFLERGTTVEAAQGRSRDKANVNHPPPVAEPNVLPPPVLPPPPNGFEAAGLAPNPVLLVLVPKPRQRLRVSD
jgi:hypothetical protein